MRTIILMLIVIFCHSCVTQKTDKRFSEDYQLLNQTLRSNKIYVNSYSSKQYGKNFIKTNLKNLVINHVSEDISNSAYKQIDSIKMNVIKDKVKDSLIEIIKRQKLLPKVSDFLNDDDIAFMAENVNQRKKWDSEAFIKEIQVSADRAESNRVSKPIYNVKGDIAAYLIEGKHSLSMIFCMKKKSHWRFHCSATVWIE